MYSQLRTYGVIKWSYLIYFFLIFLLFRSQNTVSWGTVVRPSCYCCYDYYYYYYTTKYQSGVQVWLVLLKSRFLGMPTLEKFHFCVSHVFCLYISNDKSTNYKLKGAKKRNLLDLERYRSFRPTILHRQWVGRRMQCTAMKPNNSGDGLWPWPWPWLAKAHQLFDTHYLQ